MEENKKAMTVEELENKMAEVEKLLDEIRINSVRLARKSEQIYTACMFDEQYENELKKVKELNTYVKDMNIYVKKLMGR